MENQLITFETAVLAKEKGFDKECLHFYTKPQSKMFGIDEHGRGYPIKNKSKSLYVIGEHAALNIESVFSAPTQSLLQRWLREEHNLHIILNTSINTNGKVTFYCNTIKFGKNLYKSVFRSKSLIYTYEEALEVGLQEGLKFIK